MNLDDARDLALELIAEFLPADEGWAFGWHNRKRVLGTTTYSVRRIQLSRPLVLANDRAQVEDTIRHEIAHAIAGGAAGHGLLWRLACQQTGARPQTYAVDANLAPAPWLIACSVDGVIVARRYKRPPAGRAFRCRCHREACRIVDNRRRLEELDRVDQASHRVAGR